MTAKNRNKASSGEKTPASPAQVAAPPKQQKSNDGVTVTKAPAPVSSAAVKSGGGGGGGFQWILVLFYVALVAAGGFAAFYIQQALEEIHQLGTKHEETAREHAKLHGNMESVLQQVESARGVLDGMESSLVLVRSEVRRGELERQRLEESLQKLQNDLLRDLSAGVREVKEARERDFSSLESTVEQRLAEVSRSVSSSAAEFADAQGEVRGQLARLEARLGADEDPALVKRELAAVAEAVAELVVAGRAAEASAASLGEQIVGVGAELQTRNQEVASLSQEVGAVRALMQETAGSLRQSVTAAEAGAQEARDRSQGLEEGVAQAQEAVRSLQAELQEREAQQALQRSEDQEARAKASDEAARPLAELSSRVEALVTKYDSRESALAAQGQAAEEARAGLAEELQALKAGVEEMRSSVAELAEAKRGGAEAGERAVAELDGRLSELERSTRDSVETPKHLESLRGLVVSLEGKTTRLEQHEQAISALQDAVEKTTSSLAALSTPGKQTASKKP